MDSKKMVEGCPATLKEGVSKEDADKVKADVEAGGYHEAGHSVAIKDDEFDAFLKSVGS